MPLKEKNHDLAFLACRGKSTLQLKEKGSAKRCTITNPAKKRDQGADRSAHPVHKSLGGTREALLWKGCKRQEGASARQARVDAKRRTRSLKESFKLYFEGPGRIKVENAQKNFDEQLLPEKGNLKQDNGAGKSETSANTKVLNNGVAARRTDPKKNISIVRSPSDGFMVPSPPLTGNGGRSAGKEKNREKTERRERFPRSKDLAVIDCKRLSQKRVRRLLSGKVSKRS